MNNPTVRRIGTTYGKSAKRLLVHDFFDDRNSQGTEPQAATTQHHVVPTSSTGVTEPAQKITTKLNIIASRASSPSPSNVSEIRGRHSSPDSKPDKDPFDIDSSSDEQTSNGSGKRRKITKSLRANEDVRSRQPLSSKQKSENLALSTSKSDANSVHVRAVSRAKAVQQTEGGNTIARSAKLKPKQARKTAAQSKSARQPPLQNRSAQSSFREQTVPGSISGGGTLAVNDGGDVSDHLSDRSESSASVIGTPKRKRLSTPSSDGNVPSPNQLGITLLRLSTEKKASPRSVASSESMNEDVELPRRTRTRLIDRLDAPEPERQNSEEIEEVQKTPSVVHEKVMSPENARVRGRKRIDSSTRSSQPSSIPASDRSISSQGRVTYAAKPRTTYAKERSHLSDMTDGLDLLSAPSSQPSNQTLLQPMVMSSLTSQLDMEMESDDNDDQPHVGKLKSIHELRQAGAMNRYDREFQALLEDVESTGTATHSIRIYALSKLIRKLDDANFLNFVASDTRFSRLATCASPDLDPTGAMLLTVILSALCRVNTSSDMHLQLYNAVIKFAPRLLSIDCSFTQFVEEQKSNFSKSVGRDLVKLEEWILQHGILVGYTHDHIYPDQLVLRLLDDTLRQMLRLGNNHAKLSVTTYEKVLWLLDSQSKRLAHQEKEAYRMPTIERALSLLEACSMVFDSTNVKVDVYKYKILGESLSVIMQFVKDDQVAVEQSALRAVVSLSNQNPAMCRVLGDTTILDTVFAVISTNFSILAEHAELEQGLDEAKLDSVILALGCLLNFAECDGGLRLQLADGGPKKLKYLEELVKMFNSQVSKTQEATTQEESQVLVAFGYLSMLLCTLSLDIRVRTQITGRLKEKSFEQVCVAAETFFQHLRTVESISEDDASMSAFTARFNAILETVRKPIK